MATQDAQTLVLCTLIDGPLHGYGINAAIERLSGNRLGPGSLYGALSRLEGKGLVESLPGEGRARPVRITERGRAVLEREARSMARVTERVFESVRPDEVRYLDRVAASDAGRAYKGLMLDALAIRPGHTVLDLGCGPGTDLGAMAGAANGNGSGSGRVIGVDIDEEMAARARERTAGLPGVEIAVADMHTLPYEDGSADRARTDRALQHAADPAAVLAEVRRVLRPGGRIVMGEPDWDSLALDHPDRAVSRAYTRYIADEAIRNGTLGRELARLAAGAGFTVPTVLPVVSVFRDVQAADAVLGLKRNTERAVAAGYLTAGAGRDLLDHLATGPFLATVTLYVVVAEVPAG
ncbi:methyltransferase domain-containing protein [Streptomyces yaizuensis]|uniref:Methyltransferase domain-containing protein n=1 Tax=Streptomyces yaizuensis TaxID=2989713 RepID=A0ABQ5P1L1_9ACTN|nr:methyltransferase domain-containing protein [Streptomyces sp. YSPA8]GLF96499.1 methyltransferase domain-containing protein [Streptomyces sp. YSPA8]